jgi:hypothetical protein
VCICGGTATDGGADGEDEEEGASPRSSPTATDGGADGEDEEEGASPRSSPRAAYCDQIVANRDKA